MYCKYQSEIKFQHHHWECACFLVWTYSLAEPYSYLSFLNVFSPIRRFPKENINHNENFKNQYKKVVTNKKKSFFCCCKITTCQTKCLSTSIHEELTNFFVLPFKNWIGKNKEPKYNITNVIYILFY